MRDEPPTRIEWLTGAIDIDWDRMPFIVVVNGEKFERLSNLERRLRALVRKV